MTQTYDVTFDPMAEVDDLRERLRVANQKTNEAEERADANYKALEDFKKRVVEEGLKHAERHDWCSTYDEIMAELGLPGRERPWTVQVRVHFTAETEVMAHSYDDAVAKIEEAERDRRFRTTSPITGYGIRDFTDVVFEVIE